MNFLNDLKNFSTDTFLKVKEKTTVQAQVTKETLNLNKLEKALKEEYLKLGKYFYNNQNNLSEKDYGHLTTKIASLKIDIKKLKEKIDNIRDDSIDKINNIKDKTYIKTKEIKQTAKEKTDEIKEDISIKTEIIKDHTAKIKNDATNTIDDFKEASKKAKQDIKENTENILENLNESFDKASEEATKIIDDIKNPEK